MDQKTFNNIVLFFIVLYIIKNLSPEKDSVLYVFQKYLNYIIYKIKDVFAQFGFGKVEDFITGISKYKNKTPSFKTQQEIKYVNYFKKVYPKISEATGYKLYYFIKSLISIDTNQYFLTPSDTILNEFNDNEKNKLKTIILNKLNSNKQFKFSQLKFESEPKYYINISGKEIDPFVFNVQINIGNINIDNIKIYIHINIRNDVYENKEYVVINDIKPIIDKNIIVNNDIKTKTKKVPFTGDVNLIFNDALDNKEDSLENNEEHIEEEIKVEKLDRIVPEEMEVIEEIIEVEEGEEEGEEEIIIEEDEEIVEILDEYGEVVNKNKIKKPLKKNKKTSNYLLAYNDYDNLDFITAFSTENNTQ